MANHMTEATTYDASHPFCYIAVDGGGSKTEFALYDCATGDMQHFFFGSSNYKIAEVDTERAIILEGLQHIFSETDVTAAQVKGLVMGMSGCDAPGDYAHYLEIAMESGIPQEKIYVCNDSELAFYSAGCIPGLCVIAGTGSIVMGIAPDRTKARSGGWGTPISDEGSGCWIGIKALQALLRYCDGYGPYQAVFEVILRHFAASTFEDLPKILTQCSITEIAGVAKPIMEEADTGDPYALALVHEAAELVATIALSVYRKLRFEKEPSVDIVMAGSLFKSPAFHQRFAQHFQLGIPTQNSHLCDEVASPVMGGIALAKAMFD